MKRRQLRIDVEAAKALVYWKSLFADEVAARARRLAAESSEPEHVTLTHYRQAARVPFAHFRLRFGTEGHPLTTTRSREPEQSASPGAISAETDLWIRQFTRQFELHILDASRDLPPNASVSESQMATARAIVATYLDSGMDLESVMELARSSRGRIAVCRCLLERRVESPAVCADRQGDPRGR